MDDSAPGLDPSFAPAPLGRRFFAGLLDLLFTGALGAAFAWGTIRLGAAGLPLIAAVLAIVVWLVAPVVAFKTTPMLRLFGLSVVDLQGRRPDFLDMVQRELLGRGLIGWPFGIMLVTTWLAREDLSLSVPTTGFVFVLWAASGGVALLGVCGQIVILTRPDRRSLADLVAKTMVVERKTALAAELQPDDDEESRAMARKAAGRRVRTFVIGEVFLCAAAVAGPYLYTRPIRGGRDLMAWNEVNKAEKAFRAEPSDREAADHYIGLLLQAGEDERAAEVRAERSAAAEERAKDPGAHDYRAGKLRSELAKTPCQKGTAVELAERLNEIGDHQGALKFSREFFAQCGEFYRLRWPILHAYRQTGDLSAAVEQSTKLIEEMPHDSDYWWWRGEDEVKIGNQAQGDSDFRHSMAVETNDFAAERFVEMWKTADPCEASLALRAVIVADPDAEWAIDQRQDLELAGGCKGRTAGRATLRGGKNGETIETSAKVNGKAGKFAVYSTGYVTLTRAFAERAGISGAGDARVFAAGAHVAAKLGRAERVEVSGAKSESVPVAVVETLPGGLDGLIGLSFLWRFDVERTTSGLVLKAP